ncbi:MAG: hypothetical protein ABSA90_01940 [Xanthobacteraceae bacterium]|jgi:hypothetical protein
MSAKIIPFPSRLIVLEASYTKAVCHLKDQALEAWAAYFVSHYPERVATGITQTHGFQALSEAAQMLQIAADDLRARLQNAMASM